MLPVDLFPLVRTDFPAYASRGVKHLEGEAERDVHAFELGP